MQKMQRKKGRMRNAELGLSRRELELKLKNKRKFKKIASYKNNVKNNSRRPRNLHWKQSARSNKRESRRKLSGGNLLTRQN